MKRFSRFLPQLAGLTLRAPKSALLLSLVLTLLSVAAIRRLEIRTNISDLLPDHHPAVIQARTLDNIVGGASFVVMALESDNFAAADRFLSDFVEKGRTVPGVRMIDDRPPAEFLRKEGLLYLSLEELDRLKDKVKMRIDQGKLKRSSLFIDLDEPKGETDEWKMLQEKYAFYADGSPRYQSRDGRRPDGRLLVALIKPDWRTPEVAKTEALLAEFDRIVGALDPIRYDPSLKVRWTGPYVKILSQKAQLIQDAIKVSLISLIGVVLYLFFHFRRPRAIILIGIPMIVSSLWALGVAYLLFGSLNLFSSVACAIILGLSADYGIHLYTDFERHRLEGKTVDASLLEATQGLGKAFIAASTTTAAAFFALSLSRFKAMFELGIIGGIGIILCVIAFMLIFPPLVRLWEKWRPLRHAHVTCRMSHVANRMTLLMGLSQHPLRNFVALTLLLLLPIGAVFAGRLQFDFDMTRIYGQEPTKALDRQVDLIFNHTVNPEVALASSPTDAAPLAESLRRVQKESQKKEGGTTIKGVLSFPDLIPSHQKEKIEKIAQMKGLFTKTVVAGLSDKERKSYETLKPLLNPRPITLQSLPESLKNKFVDREGVLGRMVFIFPNFPMSDGKKLMRFVEEIRDVNCAGCSGPAYASGESTVFYEIVKMLFHDGRFVIGFALLAIFAALLFNFRSVKAALIAFAPLMVGLGSTLGWMALTGTRFNIINLAAIPIILGTADDYSIHFFERYRQSGDLRETGRRSFRPIVGSALTTVIGFGSLLAANIGGVRSFGSVVVIGVALCCVTTLYWFPSFLHLLSARKVKVSYPLHQTAITEETP